ncbi:MAG TPA: PEP-utilizing enzyme, partial [Anaerolineae bacterium]|nr:PEP-utilizing enzyme [Anaerolineae bacterium]
TQLNQSRTPQDILQIIDGTNALDRQLLRIHRWSLTYADVFYKILAQWTGDLAQSLISNVPNKTREVNQELGALAQLPAPLTAELLERIQNHAPLDAQEKRTADALKQFLERHGHRAFSLDLAHPTFTDDPTQLLPLIQSPPPPNEFQLREDYRIIAKRAVKNLRLWQRILFRPILTLARRYAQLREDQRYYWQQSLAVTRRAYLKLGAALTAKEILSTPQDIFYAARLEIQEYYTGQMNRNELAAKIHARREQWKHYEQEAREHGANNYPLFLRGDAPVLETKPLHVNGTEWHGRGISPGIARGVARIVHDPRELGRVNAGEILVAPSTDPAWTPVFARLAGLALERGGVLSHGAVVAREYHLPAVAAIANLTQEIQDGEEIQVDGTNGIVRRL